MSYTLLGSIIQEFMFLLLCYTREWLARTVFFANNWSQHILLSRRDLVLSQASTCIGIVHTGMHYQIL